MENKIFGPDGKEIKTDKNIEVIIPEDIMKKIKEKQDARRVIMNEFVKVSLQRAVAVKNEQELLAKLQNNTDSLNAKIEYAHKKLKLDKDVNYTYQYNSRDNKFTGFPKKKA